MDTEHFIVRRQEVMGRLQERRAKDLAAYPFRIGEDYGVKLPVWARFALSFVGRGGAVNQILQVGLPLMVPFLLKSKARLSGG